MKQRFLKYDVMRILAIAMVLLGHVSAYIVINYPDPEGAVFAVGNIFNGLRRGASVPIFLMLTGALVLNEEKPFDPRGFYKRSLLPLVWLLAFWTSIYGVFYAFILPVLLGNAADAGNFAEYVLTFKGSDYPHLWYLFMTVGLYIAVPVLRLFVRRENRTYILGFIIAAIVVQFIPDTLNFLTRNCEVTLSGLARKFHMEYATGFISYPLLGWYLANFPPARAGRIGLYVLALLAAVVSTIAVRFLIAGIPNIRDYLYGGLSLHLLVSGAGVFVLISSLCSGRLTKSSAVRTLSNASFGIYIVHVVFLELFSRVLAPFDTFGPGLVNPAWRTLTYILLLFAAVYLCSLAFVLLLSRVPAMKRLLRYQ